MRRCRYCGVEKDESEFYLGPKGFLRWKCKTCYQQDVRNWKDRSLADRLGKLIQALDSYRSGIPNNGLGRQMRLAEKMVGNPIRFKGESGATYTVMVEREPQQLDRKADVKNTGDRIVQTKPIDVRLTISVVG